MKIFMRIQNEFKKSCMNQNWIDILETGKREQKQNGESGLSRKWMSLMRKFPGHPMLEKVHGGEDNGIYVGIQWITLLGGNWFYYWKWRHYMEDCITSDSWDPMDYSPPGPSVHGVSQARILEWAAFPFSRGSSRPRDQTWLSCAAGGLLHCRCILYRLSHQGILLRSSEKKVLRIIDDLEDQTKKHGFT